MQATAKTPEEPSYDSNPFTISFRGFGLLVDYAKGVLIVLIAFGLLGFVSNIFSSISDMSNDNRTSDSSLAESSFSADSIEWGAVAAIGLFVLGVAVVIMAVALLFSAMAKGFTAAGTVAASERRHITAGQAFSEMTGRFGQLYIAEIVTTLRIIGGYLLLVIPGIRAQLRYQSTPFILMKHKDMSASQAVARSKELYRNHLMEVFGIMTVGAIIPLIGGAISASGMALSVNQISEYKDAGRETPPTHWLNYLGLILAGLSLFFIVGIVILLAIAFAN